MNILITEEFLNQISTNGIGFTSNAKRILKTNPHKNKGWKQRLLGTRVELSTEELNELYSSARNAEYWLKTKK